MALNLSEVDAMEHLMGAAMGPVELSRRLHMTSASATVLVDRLAEAGHVEREPDPSDGRRRVVRPTAQGASADGTATRHTSCGPSPGGCPVPAWLRAALVRLRERR